VIEEDLPAAGHDLLHVGDRLVEELVVRGHDDHRDGLVHQRDGAVLEFARGVGLGVDVADLLELERAFEGQGIHPAAAQEEDVARLGEPGGDAAAGSLMPSAWFTRPGIWRRASSAAAWALASTAAALAGGLQGQEAQDHELAGEGLGGGHADLGPARSEREIGFAGDGASATLTTETMRSALSRQ
jgi:hypothetical protein